MRCLIFGAGQVGTFAARALDAAGHVVVVADADPSPGYFSRFGPPGEIAFESADIRSEIAVATLIARVRPEVVINATGVLASASDADPATAMQVNGTAAVALARAAAGCAVRFVQVSSLSVYGPTSAPTQCETDEPDPRSVYGRSKLFAEQGIRAYASDAFQVVILRPAGVYGPVRFGCGSRSAAFIDQAVIRISRGEPLQVTLVNDPVDEFLYIKDLARAILAAATLPLQQSTTVINIGPGQVSTVAELQNALHGLDAKADIHINVQGGGHGALSLVPLDTRIAAELLDFHAAFDLRAGVLDHRKEYGL